MVAMYENRCLQDGMDGHDEDQCRFSHRSSYDTTALLVQPVTPSSTILTPSPMTGAVKPATSEQPTPKQPTFRADALSNDNERSPPSANSATRSLGGVTQPPSIQFSSHPNPASAPVSPSNSGHSMSTGSFASTNSATWNASRVLPPSWASTTNTLSFGGNSSSQSSLTSKPQLSARSLERSTSFGTSAFAHQIPTGPRALVPGWPGFQPKSRSFNQWHRGDQPQAKLSNKQDGDVSSGMARPEDASSVGSAQISRHTLPSQRPTIGIPLNSNFEAFAASNKPLPRPVTNPVQASAPSMSLPAKPATVDQGPAKTSNTAREFAQPRPNPKQQRRSASNNNNRNAARTGPGADSPAQNKASPAQNKTTPVQSKTIPAQTNTRPAGTNSSSSLASNARIPSSPLAVRPLFESMDTDEDDFGSVGATPVQGEDRIIQVFVNSVIVQDHRDKSRFMRCKEMLDCSNEECRLGWKDEAAISLPGLGHPQVPAILTSTPKGVEVHVPRPTPSPANTSTPNNKRGVLEAWGAASWGTKKIDYEEPSASFKKTKTAELGQVFLLSYGTVHEIKGFGVSYGIPIIEAYYSKKDANAAAWKIFAEQHHEEIALKGVKVGGTAGSVGEVVCETNVDGEVSLRVVLADGTKASATVQCLEVK